jgi:DNA-binding response OmpR family regulator
LRILVIDDEEPMRLMLRRSLTKAGYETFEAANGKEALSLQEKNPADLIITDIIMPEMEGIDTIMTFRENYPKVKIIAISGGGQIGSDEYLDLADKLGADWTFAKPFSINRLMSAVEELLGPGKNRQV